MAQVFADDDQVAAPGIHTRVVQIPKQQSGHRPVSQPLSEPLSLGSTMTPGKGVRQIRCVGCAHDTLPRNDDGAPLCQRCSERLAAADTGTDGLAAPMIFRTPRWLRRRPTFG